MDLIIFVVVLYAITNIITKQFIFNAFRRVVKDKFGDESYIYKLVTCPVCLGFYISIPLSILLSTGVPFYLIPFFGSGSIIILNFFAKDEYNIID